MDINDPNMVYIKVPDGNSAGIIQSLYEWLDEYDHSIYIFLNDWRELEGWQCAARHSYLLGIWVGIARKPKNNRFWNPKDYDTNVLTLFKLAHAG